MSRLRRQLASLRLYMKIMQTPVDLYEYARLRALAGPPGSTGTAGKPRHLRLRSLGGASIVCRPSQDVWTLKATFFDQFHLPPVTLPENATIVDLGSNVGYTVAHMAHLFPSARMLGVELDRRNFDLAVQNTEHVRARVQLVHAAVWDSDGVVEYDADCGDDAFSVTGMPTDASNRTTAPAKRIQTLLDECGIGWVDYLKMDIEGAEATILVGDLSWCDRVGSLKIEVHPPATNEFCRAVLAERGFRTWRDDHHRDCVCAVRA